MTETWKVRRHGGKRSDEWRTVFSGNESDARREYEKAFAAMRQGGVVLVAPDQHEEERAVAPRVRSRW